MHLFKNVGTNLFVLSFLILTLQGVSYGSAAKKPTPTPAPTATPVPAPTITVSNTTFIYVKGTAIAAIVPSINASVTSISISPNLTNKTGLAFDTATGTISGTPTTVSAATSYTLTATNSAKKTATVNISIQVNDVPPSISVAGSPFIYRKGTAITAVTPSLSSSVKSVSISPDITQLGFKFNTTTGKISGTPGSVTAATTYTLTASSGDGDNDADDANGKTASAKISITVNDLPPSNLTYANSTAIYLKGYVIPNNPPTNTGGAVLSYTVSPALPAGVALSPMTGIISGTPSAASAAANYVVTANNSGGSTTSTVNITVKTPPAPSTAPGCEYTLQIVDFKSTDPKLTAARVFAGSTEVLQNADGYYHVTLSDSTGKAIVDNNTLSALPTGVWEVKRSTNGFISGNWGHGSSGYVYYNTYAVMNCNVAGVTNDKNYPYEHQGDGIYKEGKAAQDEFVVSGNMMIGDTTTTSSGDFYDVSYIRPLPPSAPTALSGTSPTNNSTPTITVSGVIAGNEVTLYSTSNCDPTSILGVETVIGTTAVITSAPISNDTTYYATQSDPNSRLMSTCSTASFALIYDITGPSVAITSGPGQGTTITSGDSAIFVFTATDIDGAQSACSLDGATASSCSGSITYSGLSVGDHSFTITSTDGAGNKTTDTQTFTVVAPKPTGCTITSFTADSTTVGFGDSTTLHWSTSMCGSGSIDQSIGVASPIDNGSAPSGSISQTTTYTLTASSFKVLHEFTYGSDGGNPFTNSLIFSADGNTLYGTTPYGGDYGEGVIFSMDLSGNVTPLYEFTGGADGSSPQSTLTLSKDGTTLYGTAQSGGANGFGTVFSIHTDGSFTNGTENDDGVTMIPMYSFANTGDGSYPFSPVTLSKDGTTLYGTTLVGETGNGTIYSLRTDGTFTALYAFTGNEDGGYSYGKLALSPDGTTLYGTTTSGGGVNQAGTIFSIHTDGTFTNGTVNDDGVTMAPLYTFTGNEDGGYTEGGLALTKDGTTLYGVNLYSILFSIHSDGTFTNGTINDDGVTMKPIYTFQGGDEGNSPYGGVILSSDEKTLYGMMTSGGAHRGGDIFSIHTDGSFTNGTAPDGRLAPLYTFNWTYRDPNGYWPEGTLVLSKDESTLYGMTFSGGSSSVGTIFSVAPTPPVQAHLTITAVLSPPSAPSNVFADPGDDETSVYVNFTPPASNGGSNVTSYTITASDGTNTFSASGSSSPVEISGLTPGASYTYIVTATNGVGTSAASSASGLEVLHDFTYYGSDGGFPGENSVTLSPDGSMLYGIVPYGGTYGYGDIFSITLTGTPMFTTIYSFTGGVDGWNADNDLTVSADGTTLYGVTFYGGDYNAGTIFSIHTDGSFTNGTVNNDGMTMMPLYSFTGGSDGGNPTATKLLLTADGSTLYGVTINGGANGGGTFYSVHSDGSFTNGLTNDDGSRLLTPIANFDANSYPIGHMAMSSDELTIYGTTEEGGAFTDGTIYKASVSDGTINTIYTFTGGQDGGAPYGIVLSADNSTLYGMVLFNTNNYGGIYGIHTDGSFIYGTAADGSMNLLHSFASDGSEGGEAYATLALAPDQKTLYGADAVRGASNHNSGALFSVTTDGAFNLLYTFTGKGDGSLPQTTVALSPDGKSLYGMATRGGAYNLGVVFKSGTLPPR